MTEPFHSGEREIQERTGERDRAVLNGRVIGRSIPAAASAFLTQQRYCVLGWVSPEGDVWSRFLNGPAGFAAAGEDGATLLIDLDGGGAALDSIPPFGRVSAGDHLGILFIELATRRRLRVNGQAAEVTPSRLRVDVAAAFANCPKYIQRRELMPEPGTTKTIVESVERGHGLNDDLTAWIAGADTLFVASAHPDGPADSSHRGGKPGFVRIVEGNLHIPDYPGNSMFSTLGNFAANPRAGLAFVDFQGNRQLQLTGDVRLDLDAGENAGATGGTGRWWVFSPRRWLVSPLSPELTWESIDDSPYNP